MLHNRGGTSATFPSSAAVGLNKQLPLSGRFVATADVVVEIDNDGDYDDDDVDNPNVKYRKRRSVKQSPPHMIGLFLLFTLILSVWHHYLGIDQYHRSRRSDLRSLLPLSRSSGIRQQQQKQLQRRRFLEEKFLTQRKHSQHSSSSSSFDTSFDKYDSDKRGKNIQRPEKDEDAKKRLGETLTEWLHLMDSEIRNNVDGGIRWIRPYLLPPFKKSKQQQKDDDADYDDEKKDDDDNELFLSVSSGENLALVRKHFFHVERDEIATRTMQWESEWQNLVASGEPIPGPPVDYTDRNKYRYPQLLQDVPASPSVYPPLKPLGDILAHWDQDEDFPGIIQESLLHFNYSNPKEAAVAKKFRDAELPFKLYDIPEIDAATQKWTDEYLDAGFKEQERHQQEHGHAQESPDNFFAFYLQDKWSLSKLGLAPVRDNWDWDFATFANHARYADATRLSPHRPHFYWQSGTPAEQRWLQNENEQHDDAASQSFISRDLPSFSSPKENNFFVFHTENNRGVQCRFGERGVVAATHYDSSMNFVAMITGAKRYILQPPRECSKIGLVTDRRSPVYRHSLLNFAHLKYLKNNQHSNTDDDAKAAGMSDEERAWLEKASKAQSIETVLRQGEALYIPSNWFHYIVSLQKSAQCNTRSGPNVEGHPFFGNAQTVHECRDY